MWSNLSRILHTRVTIVQLSYYYGHGTRIRNYCQSPRERRRTIDPRRMRLLRRLWPHLNRLVTPNYRKQLGREVGGVSVGKEACAPVFSPLYHPFGVMVVERRSRQWPRDGRQCLCYK